MPDFKTFGKEKASHLSLNRGRNSGSCLTSPVIFKAIEGQEIIEQYLQITKGLIKGTLVILQSQNNSIHRIWYHVHQFSKH